MWRKKSVGGGASGTGDGKLKEKDDGGGASCGGGGKNGGASAGGGEVLFFFLLTYSIYFSWRNLQQVVLVFSLQDHQDSKITRFFTTKFS